MTQQAKIILHEALALPEEERARIADVLLESLNPTSRSMVDYLEERAKRGSREKFLAVLAKVPDVAPDP